MHNLGAVLSLGAISTRQYSDKERRIEEGTKHLPKASFLYENCTAKNNNKVIIKIENRQFNDHK